MVSRMVSVAIVTGGNKGIGLSIVKKLWFLIRVTPSSVKGTRYRSKYRLLTHIGKSRKQNPKIGCVIERHFRKQNPTQISADDDVTCLKYFWYR